MKNFSIRRSLAAILHRINFIIPNDEIYLRVLFKLYMGQKLSLSAPKTFAEKIQWLKLYNRNTLFIKLVDKYEVKSYVADIIGEEYIIPTLGVWDSFDDIDFDLLPNHFVLKTTHDGGGAGVVICKDKKSLHIKNARTIIKRSLRRRPYKIFREWPYKGVKPRIIAEKYLCDDHLEEIPDYKFYCFDGIPMYCQVIRGRKSNETIDFYDMQWNHMPFVGLNPVVKNGPNPVVKPQNLAEMVLLCEKLAKGLIFSRIDLYIVNNKVYFGEITLFPAAGIGEFTPKEWNYKLGDLIKLPIERR